MGPTASPPIAFASGEACFTPEDIDFSWQAADVPAPLTVTYTLQISNSAAFPAGPETLEVSGLTTTFHTVDGAGLRPFTTNFQHYWRVIATSNTGAETIAGPIMFTTQNRADFNDDGEVDGADLATLLSVWGSDGSSACADVVENQMVDGEDLAFLLANWTGSGQPVMAMPSASGGEMGSGLLDESEAPSAASFTDVPWIIAHFGFASLEDYLTWLGMLDDAQLTAHVLALIELLQGE